MTNTIRGVKLIPMLLSRLVLPALLVAGAAWGMEPPRALSAPAPASRELPHAGQLFTGASLASQPRFVNPTDVEHRLFNFDIENSLDYSFVVLTLSVGAASIGFRLQRTAPFASLSDKHRSDSRAALGLATFLTSIKIGIVSNDAIGSFDQANLNIQGWAIDLLSLGKVLKNYDPDAMAIGNS